MAGLRWIGGSKSFVRFFLASTDRHGSVSILVVSEGLGDGSPVVASDVGGARRRLFEYCWVVTGLCGVRKGWLP